MLTGKYSPWIATVTFGILVVACFLPWTFHADLGKYFNGFYSEKNIYGKPGKFLIVAGAITVVSAFVQVVWIKRAGLFVSAINVAYAVTAFIRFGSCYDGYCPERKVGLFLMLITAIILLAVSMLPKGKVINNVQAPESSTTEL
jgi:hypothetical protein